MKSAQVFALTFLLVLTSGLTAQEKKKKDPSLLTLERIFSSSDFKTESLGSIVWLKKTGGYATLVDSKDHKGAQDIVRVDPKTGESSILASALQLTPDLETSPLSISDFKFSPNEALILIFTNTRRVWRNHTRGDYYVYDISGRTLRQLGGKDAKASTLMFAKFSPDNRKVAYVRERNLYVENLNSREIKQITFDGSKEVINGTSDWVYEEELGLRDCFRWAPDSTHLAYWQFNTKGVGVFKMINNVDALYPKIYPFNYPKVGTTNSSVRIGLVNTSSKKPITRWMPLESDPRDDYIARMTWMGDGILSMQRLNRIQNRKEVLLVWATDEASAGWANYAKGKGAETVILTEKDAAWVDTYEEIEWLLGGKFLWLSERSGWREIYLVSKAGKEVKKITPGKFDVFEDLLHADQEGGFVYYYASPDNATEQYLYRSSLDGKKTERLTPKSKKGWNSYEISPDCKWAFHTHSAFDSPPVIDLISLPTHKVVRTIKDNKKAHEAIQKLKRGESQFFQVDIGDGVKLDAWRMRPPTDKGTAKKHPLLFYVYGEPAGQTVLNRWSGNRYLWHLMLTQQGYAVMSVDNRGTPGPRGRAWRKIVHRQVGKLAAEDQAKAVKAILKSTPWVDGKRVGVWGWSGGGSMSLHAIFRFPNLYHMAMSIAPVVNERLYDTIYQERYMDLPEDNAKGYREGSPITYARGLKGKLLLVHGTADDNVHYQNAEILVNELIRLNKQFDMMAYPNRTHSIREGKTSRRHLFGLLTRYLNRCLPVK